MKQYDSRYRKTNNQANPTKAERDAQITRLNEEYKFDPHWFPPEWLVWFCYGPPAANGRPQFEKKQMLHLVQVRAAPRPINQNEILQEIGKSRKRVRRSAPEVAGSDDDADDDVVEVGSTVSKNTMRDLVITKKVEHVHAQPSKNELLSRAIQAKSCIIQALQSRGRQDDIERIILLQDELLELYVSYIR